MQIDVVLHRDPAAINLDVADAVMSAKARKETKRAVSALKSANLKEAQKRLDDAYKLAPSSPDLNFLLGWAQLADWGCSPRDEYTNAPKPCPRWRRT